jgi:type IX secretion system PorP/SprF family membrane protein
MSFAYLTHAQESPLLTLTFPTHNNLAYNRFLLNPTFSFVGENDTHIAMFSRSQWTQFNNAPKVYLINYSGKFSEKTGFGFGLYQQYLGVISSFGGIGNYAYNVVLNDKMNLTFAFNLGYYSSGIDLSRVVVETPDPVLLAMDKKSVMTLEPGINLNYGKFDLGLTAKNLVDFDFKEQGFVKDYAYKTFVGHLMYTHVFENAQNLLEGMQLRGLARAQSNPLRDFGYAASVVSDLPMVGWLQGQYDNYYGMSFGVGFHLTNKVSFGYTYEKATQQGLQNLGASHEFNLVFSLTSRQDKINSSGDNATNIIKKLEENDSTAIALIGQRDRLIDKLKTNLDAKSYELLTLLMQQDSINNLRNEALEKRLNSLIDQLNNGKVTKKDVSKKKNAAKAQSDLDDDALQEKYSKNTAYKREKAKKGNKLVVPDVEPGYYIVANVFSEEKYAIQFSDKLKEKGLDVNVFTNPKNGYKYVYLRRYSTWEEALPAYYSNLEDTYFDLIWILFIDKE